MVGVGGVCVCVCVCVGKDNTDRLSCRPNIVCTYIQTLRTYSQAHEVLQFITHCENIQFE